MTRPLPLFVALSLAAFAASSCRDEITSPQPSIPEQPASGPDFALAPNSWTARPPIPTGRQNLDAAVVNNSAGQPVLYVIGGLNPLDEPVSRIEAYNYSTNRWITKAARGSSVATNGVGIIGGKLYISGGTADHGEGPQSIAALVAYDPVRDAFSSKASLPHTSSNGVSGVISGRLYVVTGLCDDCGSRITRNLYRYNPGTNAWKALTSCPNAHLSGAGGVINGKFYVAGGGSARLDVYNPATNSWKALAPMPRAVSGAAGAVIKNKLYIIGGNGKTVYAYDPVTNKWTTKAPLLTGRYWLAAASLITPSGNPKILAVGGYSTGDEGAFTANELYTP